MLCAVAIIHLLQRNTAVICAVLSLSCFGEIQGTVSLALTRDYTWLQSLCLSKSSKVTCSYSFRHYKF